MTGPAGNGRPGPGEVSPGGGSSSESVGGGAAPGGAARARPHFGERLANAVEARRSQIVLGIDPDPMKLWPAAVEGSSEARARLASTLSEADPLPRTVISGGRVSRRPSMSMYCSACAPPVRIAVASALAQTGSPQASYAHRGPRTECSMVPTRWSSAPTSGAAR